MAASELSADATVLRSNKQDNNLENYLAYIKTHIIFFSRVKYFEIYKDR